MAQNGQTMAQNVRTMAQNVQMMHTHTGIMQTNCIYRLFSKTVIQEQAEVNACETNLKIWHERLAHLNLRAIKELTNRNMIDGLQLSDKNNFFCEPCQLGKQHRLRFKRTVDRKTSPGENIFIVMCVAHYQKSPWVVLEKFIELEKLVKNYFGRSMKVLRTDNGREYVCDRLIQYLKACDITHERTATCTPEQNGKAERDNRTIMEAVGTMLKAKNLPNALWAEAVATTVYLLNRTSISRCHNDKTAYEDWTKKRPDLSHLKRLKMVGYQDDSTNYRLYDPVRKRVEVSRNVRFDERTSKANEQIEESYITFKENYESKSEDTDYESVSSGHDDTRKDQEINPRCVKEEESQKEQQRVLRDRNKLRKPDRYEANVATFEPPATYDEAVNEPDAGNWRKAINYELEQLRKSKTLEIIPKTSNMKTIDSKWIFKIKPETESTPLIYRAPLCARGFMQREGEEYNETYAPVVRYDSIRVLLAHIAYKDLEATTFDVKSAFLYDDLKENIFMEIPKGVKS
uniref:Integrase catalytic domain-containing protein n=1 Tax=Trichogramma kaykai TaxID=54128 RepID=A0ABD2W2N1_9HYME